MRSAASENTAWIDDPQMRETLIGGSRISKELKLEELKTNPRGHSIFLCLPVDDMSTYGRWQRVMVASVISQMQQSQGLPANGHPLLMCLDEFPALGTMERLEKAAAEIAGAGVKLMTVVQNLPQLQKLYKEGWETFLGNAGLQIFFGMDDNTTRDYLQKALGEMEIVRDVRSQNKSASEQFTEGETKGHTHGTSQGRSEGGNESWNKTHGHSTSQQSSRGGNTSQQSSRGGGSSQGQSYGTNSNWSHGQSGGTSYGSNFSTSWLFGKHSSGFNETTNSGWNSSHGGGTSSSTNSNINENWSNSQGSGKNWSDSRGTGENWSDSQGGGKNWSTNSSTNQSEQYSQQSSRAQGTQRGEGIAETIQKRPLLPSNEADQFFAAIQDPDAIYYPGLALVKISGRDPIHVRKVNYDQDPAFIRCFDPHPAYPFVPVETKRFEVIEEPDHLPEPIYPRPSTPELKDKTLSDRSYVLEEDCYRKYGNQTDHFGEDPDAGIDFDVRSSVSIDLSSKAVWHYLIQTQYIGHWSAWIAKDDGVELKENFEIGDIVGKSNEHRLVWCVPGRKICFKGKNSNFVEVELKANDYESTTINFRCFMFNPKPKSAGGFVGLSIGKGLNSLFKNQSEEYNNSIKSEQQNYISRTSRDFKVYLNRMRYLGDPSDNEFHDIYMSEWLSEPGILRIEKDHNNQPILQNGRIYTGDEKFGYYEPTNRKVEFDELINEYYLTIPRSHHVRMELLEVIKKDGETLEYGDTLAIYREVKDISPNEMIAIGDKYHNGDDIPVDYLQAATWYNLAAEHGEYAGWVKLAHLYKEGKGVSKKEKFAQALLDRVNGS